MPLLFGILEKELVPRAARLDFLIANGTHRAMSDFELSRHTGREVAAGRAGSIRIFNHDSADNKVLTTLGSIPSGEIAKITDGLLATEVPVRMNRAILDCDHILICGPVFPDEVAGFSGGAKYFSPGIAGREIIDFTHWLGALITSSAILGIADTAVRRVIERAASMVPAPHSVIALVTDHEGVAGVWCGPTYDAWLRAVRLSSARHVVWIQEPARRVRAIMPEMYDDLWTGRQRNVQN